MLSMDQPAQLFYQARKMMGFTQMELASRAQVGLATIQNIEAGKANLSYSNLCAIAQALGIRIVFQTKQIDWDLLTQFGVPLLDKTTTPRRIHPNREQLIECLTRIAKDSLPTKGRELESLTSFLLAIRDHYPSTWEDLNPMIKAWLAKKQRHARIQLRRISIAALARYL